MIANNHTYCQANATVYIDGKRVGNFRLRANDNIKIERPVDADKARKLTFFNCNSDEGRAGGLERSAELGKIRVEIQKEHERERECERKVFADSTDGGVSRGLSNSSLRSSNQTQCDGSGGTALGGASNQKFYTASHIEVEPEVYRLEARMVLVAEPSVVPL